VFPSDVEKVVDIYAELIKLDVSTTAHFSVWDSATPADAKAFNYTSNAAFIQRMLFRDVTVFIVCFSVNNRESYLNCILWIGKIKRKSSLYKYISDTIRYKYHMHFIHFIYIYWRLFVAGKCPNVPYMIVGMKIDLRKAVFEPQNSHKTSVRSRRQSVSTSRRKSLANTENVDVNTDSPPPGPGKLTRGLSILEGDVSEKEGQQLCIDSEACIYMECSALRGDNVKDIVSEALCAAQVYSRQHSSSVCTIM
jgi:GTPase SAR1 family protein